MTFPPGHPLGRAARPPAAPLASAWPLQCHPRSRGGNKVSERWRGSGGEETQRERQRGSESRRLGGPLACTTTRVRDWASEILWSPSWTPKMTKAVPSTCFPYKNLRGEESLRFSSPETLSLPAQLPLIMVKSQNPSPSSHPHLVLTWRSSGPSPGPYPPLTWCLPDPLLGPSPGPHRPLPWVPTQPLTCSSPDALSGPFTWPLTWSLPDPYLVPHPAPHWSFTWALT